MMRPHLGHHSAPAGTEFPQSGHVVCSAVISTLPSLWTISVSVPSNFAPHLGHSVASEGTSAPHSVHWKKSFL